MAFGKDRSVLNTAGSFRQKASNFNSRRQESRPRGGGSGLYFIDAYRPRTDGETDVIRMIEGKYTVLEPVGEGKEVTTRETTLPYFPYVKHYDGRNERTGICSGGPLYMVKNMRQPCHGCDIHWATKETQADGKRKSERMSIQEIFAFTVVDYGLYHHLEQIDKEGKVRRDDTGKAYMQWTKCTGRGCDGCRSQCESKQGNTLHWSMSWGHYSTLLSMDKEIGKSCVTCGQPDCISSLAWVCPTCGDAAVDMSTTQFKQEDIDAITLRDYHCKCGFSGFLSEIIQCQHCTPAGKMPARATIFDVDLHVKAVPTGKNKQTTLQITRWSTPGAPHPHYQSLMQNKPLDKIFAPTPLEDQAKSFGVTGAAMARQPRTAADISSHAGPPAQAFIPQGHPQGANIPYAPQAPGAVPMAPQYPYPQPGGPMPVQYPPPAPAQHYQQPTYTAPVMQPPTAMTQPPVQPMPGNPWGLPPVVKV